MTTIDHNKAMKIIKRLDYIQSKYRLCTLKGELRGLFGDLTIELNKLNRKYK